jgi:hypothetical protein
VELRRKVPIPVIAAPAAASGHRQHRDDPRWSSAWQILCESGFERPRQPSVVALQNRSRARQERIAERRRDDDRDRQRRDRDMIRDRERRQQPALHA